MSLCCPCTRFNVVYPSQAAASRHLGLSKRTIAHHLNTHGNLDRAGMGQRRPWATQNAAKPVSVYGHVFPSRRKAAAALGLSENQIKRWLARPDHPYFVDLILGAVMRLDSRRTAAALKDADMIDRIGGKAA